MKILAFIGAVVAMMFLIGLVTDMHFVLYLGQKPIELHSIK